MRKHARAIAVPVGHATQVLAVGSTQDPVAGRTPDQVAAHIPDLAEAHIQVPVEGHIQVRVVALTPDPAEGLTQVLAVVPIRGQGVGLIQDQVVLAAQDLVVQIRTGGTDLRPIATKSEISMGVFLGVSAVSKFRKSNIHAGFKG